MLLNFAKENTSNSYHTSPKRRNKSVFQSELYSLHVLFSSPLILCWKLEGFFFKFVAVSLKSEALKKNIKKSLFFLEPLSSHTLFVASMEIAACYRISCHVERSCAIPVTSDSCLTLTSLSCTTATGH